MKPPVVVGVAGLVGLAFLVPLVVGSPELAVRSMSDDAFYYLGVAKHVAEGRGPTYDTITWTTGFHPLWMFVLAAGTPLVGAGFEGPVAWALGIGALLYLATAIPVGGAARALWGERAGWIAAGLWLSNPHAVILVGAGMEGSLHAALLAGTVWALVRTGAGEAAWGWVVASGALAGLTVAARTDALLLLPLAGLWLLTATEGTVRARLFRAATFGVLAVVPFTLWLLWAHGWTGQWVQGSADTKTIWREAMNAETGTMALTASLFGSWVVKSIVKVPAFKWALPFFPRGGRPLVHGLWVYPLLLGAAYALLLPKLWTWYFAPALVLLTLLAAGGLDAWLRRREGRKGQGAARGLFAAAMVLIAVESVGYLAVKSTRGRNAYQEDMLAAAVWMRENVEPDRVAAAWNAGIYGWYSGLRVINLDGLINNEVAARIRAGESQEAYLVRRGIRVLVDYDETVAQLDSEWRAAHLRPLRRFPATTRGGKDITVWEIGDRLLIAD